MKELRDKRAKGKHDHTTKSLIVGAGLNDSRATGSTVASTPRSSPSLPLAPCVKHKRHVDPAIIDLNGAFLAESRAEDHNLLALGDGKRTRANLRFSSELAHVVYCLQKLVVGYNLPAKWFTDPLNEADDTERRVRGIDGSVRCCSVRGLLNTLCAREKRLSWNMSTLEEVRDIRTFNGTRGGDDFLLRTFGQFLNCDVMPNDRRSVQNFPRVFHDVLYLMLQTVAQLATTRVSETLQEYVGVKTKSAAGDTQRAPTPVKPSAELIAIKTAEVPVREKSPKKAAAKKLTSNPTEKIKSNPAEKITPNPMEKLTFNPAERITPTPAEKIITSPADQKVGSKKSENESAEKGCAKAKSHLRKKNSRAAANRAHSIQSAMDGAPRDFTDAVARLLESSQPRIVDPFGLNASDDASDSDERAPANAHEVVVPRRTLKPNELKFQVTSKTHFLSDVTVTITDDKNEPVDVSPWGLEFSVGNGKSKYFKYLSSSELGLPLYECFLGWEKWFTVPDGASVVLTLIPEKGSPAFGTRLSARVMKPIPKMIDFTDENSHLHDKDPVVFAKTKGAGQPLFFRYMIPIHVRVHKHQCICIKNKTTGKSWITANYVVPDLHRFILQNCPVRGNLGYGGLEFFHGGQIDTGTNTVMHETYFNQQGPMEYSIQAVDRDTAKISRK